MPLIYLDNNATTRPADEVLAAMVSALTKDYANPSSIHRAGQRARQLVEEARIKVAALINCAAGELVFTSGGTESVNMALRGLYRQRRPRTKVITSTVEHSASIGACEQLQEQGAQIIEVGVDRTGLLDMAELGRQLDGEVAFVSLMWANNETGVLFDIPAVAELCRGKGIPLHCDATQAIGKLPVNVRAAGVDVMSFSAHKFHGPKGVGGLYVRRGTRIGPLIAGGPQENNRRGGTENVPGIVGMGAAAELAGGHLEQMQRVAQLRDRLERGILERVPESFVNGSTGARLPNTTNIGFARLESEAILLLLSEKELCASAGAACSSGSLEASHVLKAMRIEEHIAHGAIRFSLSRYTTEEDIEAALNIIPAAVAKLRSVLPV